MFCQVLGDTQTTHIVCKHFIGFTLAFLLFGWSFIWCAVTDQCPLVDEAPLSFAEVRKTVGRVANV